VSDVGEERDRVEELERAWKAWAERPGRRSPEEAGRRVVEAARQRQRRARTVRTLLATAALLAIAVTLGIQRQGPLPRATPPAASAAPVAPAPLGAGQALIWLDAETPLYMTFEAPGAAPGGLP
jgi:ferric-dicitrate binding protein FerR (iron transport regulator)